MIDFQSKIHECGYKFTDAIEKANKNAPGTSPKSQILLPKRPIRKTRVILYYTLDTYTCLFHQFAHIKLSNDSIIRFANKYGPLQLRDECNDCLHVEFDGEHFKDWTDSIMEMRLAIALLDRWRRGMNNERFNWIDDGFIMFALNEQPNQKVKASDFIENDAVLEEKFPALSEKSSPSIESNAQNELSRLFNKHTSQIPTVTRPTIKNGKIYFIRVDKPRNLIEALWLQLSNAVREERQFEPCCACDNWFEQVTGRGRKKKHCSNACRVKNSRKGTKKNKKSSAKTK